MRLLPEWSGLRVGGCASSALVCCVVQVRVGAKADVDLLYCLFVLLGKKRYGDGK